MRRRRARSACARLAAASRAMSWERTVSEGALEIGHRSRARAGASAGCGTGSGRRGRGGGHVRRDGEEQPGVRMGWLAGGGGRRGGGAVVVETAEEAVAHSTPRPWLSRRSALASGVTRGPRLGTPQRRCSPLYARRHRAGRWSAHHPDRIEALGEEHAPFLSTTHIHTCQLPASARSE